MPSDTTAKAPRRITGQLVLGVIVVLLGIITVLQGVSSNNATQRLARCQGAYVSHFADALDARTTASADAQTALDNLMRAVSGTLAQPHAAAGGRTEGVRTALDNYLHKRAQADAERRRHPYPAPPRDSCD